MSTENRDLVSCINIVAQFLADSGADLTGPTCQADTIVICASAVLHGAETIFRKLQEGSLSAKTLVLCGGVGHSTTLIWEAVARHPVYSELSDAVRGQAEGTVLELLLHRFFDFQKITETGCRVLVEDKSTNCGSNAQETRRVLESSVSLAPPASITIVQDPTMALRTKAAFEKVYEDSDHPPVFVSCPTFVPRVEWRSPPSAADQDTTVGNDDRTSRVSFAVPGLSSEGLWRMDRFTELIIGEVPRLRDDEDGYGPNGRHFIVHVDVPPEIERAWQVLRCEFGTTR